MTSDDDETSNHLENAADRAAMALDDLQGMEGDQ
jgi:hypothetical protein